MPLPLVVVAIAGFLAKIIAALCTKWGFIATTAYFVMDPIHDLIDDHILGKEAGREACAERDDAIDKHCKEMGYSPLECEEYRASVNRTTSQAEPGIIEKLAKYLGMTTDNVKYLIIAAILAVILTRG